MPSKLKKAIAVVKDQTSISLAMVKTGRTHHNSASSLEVAILKATTHEDSAINPHHLSDILRIVSSNRTHASLCARSLGRRVGRTRNWTVALKCLLVALRLLRSDDPHFPKEVLLAVKSGHNLLDLSSSASVVSSSCPRPISSFVRSFAAFLGLRLHSLLSPSHRLLDRLPLLQRLLAKALSMASGPSAASAARSSRLVQASLHAVVLETFDLYKDISDALAAVLDGFFHLDYDSCVAVLDACVKASSQFDELAAFYDSCRSSKTGLPSGYPDVRRIPEELIDTLQEFLKDRSSFPTNASGRRRLSLSIVGFTSSPKASDHCDDDAEERLYSSYDHDRHSDPGDETHSPMADLSGTRDFASVRSDPDGGLDFFEDGGAAMLRGTTSGEKDDDESSEESGDQDASARGWELALLETAMQQPSTSNGNAGFGVGFLEENVDPSPLSYTPSSPNQYKYNPFLQDTPEDPSPVSNVGISNDDFFRTLGLGDGDATPSTMQPNFWVDFSDQGKGDSVANVKEVDLFANFDKGSAYNGNAVGSGAVDLFASFDNVNSAFPVAFDGESFHANAPNEDAAVTPGPSNEFARLNHGYENVNARSTALGVDYGANPLMTSVATNELAGKDMFSPAPTFKATPTFKVGNDVNQEGGAEQGWRDDFFGSFASVEQGDSQIGSRSTADQQNVMKQQQMWLQIQDKILTKHST